MRLNLTQGVTAVSREVYDLHMLVMWICTAIGVVVFGAMFWSMIFHRKSKGAKPATFHESTKVEILWTAIPIVILIAMAIPATSTLIDMENNDDADITIQITGSQWKWHYKYFDQDIEFYSVLSTPKEQYQNQHNNPPVVKGEHYLLEVDKPLVIPVHKKVRFLITSDDVIHSWWVPAFAVKQDANPGFINEAWVIAEQPGIYRGQCAELCGKDHGFMPVVVEVKSEADYETWLQQQQTLIAQAAAAEKASLNSTLALDELMALGETTYMAHCAACHQPTGLGLPPAFPALKGSKVALGDPNVHINIVLNGRAGTGMQGYGKQLTLKEIAAVVTYERNAWGNNTGEAIQTTQIAEQLNRKVEPASAPAGSTTKKTDLVIEAEAAVEYIAGTSPPEAPNKTYSMGELMTMGQEVYKNSCAACHQATGLGLPPVFPPLKGSAIVKSDKAAHINMVVNGSKKNPAMAAFKSMLSPTQIAAVITYERNAWDNNTGDMVQPADIALASEE